jgi:asparagine synthase (glutamine-hydrolysing)
VCGVAGFVSWSARAALVPDTELAAINDALAHRGPDGHGMLILEDGRVGLAHRRLAIIDPTQAGAQPMPLPGRNLHITFNGEIYNFLDLRRELEDQGAVLRSRTDTEVLLHLYDRLREDMVGRLRGMYAFAIWDGDAKRLFLARDPYGIKPLYYHWKDGIFRFASEVKALLRSSAVERRPNPAAKVGFFMLGYIPEPHTIIEGVGALPAGSSIIVDRKGVGEPRRFASFHDALRARSAAKPPKSKQEALDTVLSAIKRSVHDHLVADVPIGVFLSSGLDSSLIASIAGSVLGEGLRTFTLTFDEFVGTDEDEGPLAEEVARAVGAHHTSCRLKSSDCNDLHDSIFCAMDQPSIDGVNSYLVSKVVAERGIKVALSGLGGDELLAAYSTFKSVPRLVRFFAPFGTVKGLGRGIRIVSAPLFKCLTSPKYAGLFEYGTDIGSAYLLRRGLFMPWELPEILDPDLVRAGLAQLELREALQQTSEGFDPTSAVAILEVCWYMRNQLLRDADWASMAHSLEVRTPLADWFLFQEVAPLIGSDLLPSRRDLTAHAPLALPPSLLRRAKSGFSIPIKEWQNQKLVPNRLGHSTGSYSRSWARVVMGEYERRWNL